MGQNTKDQFEDIGEVIRNDINGMAVFEMPLLDKDGKKTKKTEEMKLAVKASRGDRVVKLVGKPRSYMVIPAAEWAQMPATEEARLAEIAAHATPQLAELAMQMASLSAKNAELEARLDGAKQ